jgi:hypothetical protein
VKIIRWFYVRTEKNIGAPSFAVALLDVEVTGERSKGNQEWTGGSQMH